jgi:hypothetical protein
VNSSTPGDTALLQDDGLHLSIYGSAVLAKKLKTTLRYYNELYNKNAIPRAVSVNDNKAGEDSKSRCTMSDEQKQAAVKAFACILNNMS